MKTLLAIVLALVVSESWGQIRVPAEYANDVLQFQRTLDWAGLTPEEKHKRRDAAQRKRLEQMQSDYESAKTPRNQPNRVWQVPVRKIITWKEGKDTWMAKDDEITYVKMYCRLTHVGESYVWLTPKQFNQETYPELAFPLWQQKPSDPQQFAFLKTELRPFDLQAVTVQTEGINAIRKRKPADNGNRNTNTF